MKNIDENNKSDDDWGWFNKTLVQKFCSKLDRTRNEFKTKACSAKKKKIKKKKIVFSFSYFCSKIFF